jgi:acetolactate synthase-1/2/3 large subunit
MKDISRTVDGKITGGHMLARAMKAKGIKRVFGLCGGLINPIFIGLKDYDIEIITARNEQEAGFMANAMARTTREVSVCIAEPSGFTNYVSAVADAFNACDPVMYISSSANTHYVDSFALKELPQPDVVKWCTKYAIEVNEGQRIGWFFDKAYDIAINHPTGPVQLSIPTNYLFSGSFNTKPPEGARTFDPTRKKIHQPCPNPEDVELIVKTLRKAKKPVIISGSGVWHAGADKELEEFSSRHRIPVFVPFTDLKSIGMAHEFNMGLIDYHQNPCSRMIGEEADVVLFLGGRLGFYVNYGESPLFPNAPLIAVNPTARELSDNMLADIRICSDLKMFLQTLNARSDVAIVESNWVERIRNRRKESFEQYQETLASDKLPIHPLRLCYDVLMSLGENDIIVIDGGDIASWFETAINGWASKGRKIKGILNPSPWEHMGVGAAYTTAAQLAHKNSRVVLISGDGALGLAPGLTPMETAIHNNLPVVMIVANNGRWAMIWNQQEAMWGRVSGTSLRGDMEYHKIFEAAGAYSQLVESPNDIKRALQRALDKNAPSFIEVKTEGIISPITEGLVDLRMKSAAE